MAKGKGQKEKTPDSTLKVDDPLGILETKGKVIVVIVPVVIDPDNQKSRPRKEKGTKKK